MRAFDHDPVEIDTDWQGAGVFEQMHQAMLTRSNAAGLNEELIRQVLGVALRPAAAAYLGGETIGGQAGSTVRA
ncbi:hypothetical protein GCM10011610_71140 [Nocardia rhizosphaerihabitans]|uniref:Uncharacterized protein n=1 Tax=Nocardia rhizosphaerihabitans TaxID=1691570 RepID=A0ABQ2L3S4_9NOCA|nr:hypothetical protein GCM10011610_71140 [Nocardia rhizosphaerihabitans]